MVRCSRGSLRDGGPIVVRPAPAAHSLWTGVAILSIPIEVEHRTLMFGASLELGCWCLELFPTFP